MDISIPLAISIVRYRNRTNATGSYKNIVESLKCSLEQRPKKASTYKVAKQIKQIQYVAPKAKVPKAKVPKVPKVNSLPSYARPTVCSRTRSRTRLQSGSTNGFLPKLSKNYNRKVPDSVIYTMLARFGIDYEDETNWKVSGSEGGLIGALKNLVRWKNSDKSLVLVDLFTQAIVTSLQTGAFPEVWFRNLHECALEVVFSETAFNSYIQAKFAAILSIYKAIHTIGYKRYWATIVKSSLSSIYKLAQLSNICSANTLSPSAQSILDQNKVFLEGTTYFWESKGIISADLIRHLVKFQLKIIGMFRTNSLDTKLLMAILLYYKDAEVLKYYNSLL